jgi:hypothetical protein
MDFKRLIIKNFIIIIILDNENKFSIFFLFSIRLLCKHEFYSFKSSEKVRSKLEMIKNVSLLNSVMSPKKVI